MTSFWSSALLSSLSSPSSLTLSFHETNDNAEKVSKTKSENIKFENTVSENIGSVTPSPNEAWRPSVRGWGTEVGKIRLMKGFGIHKWILDNFSLLPLSSRFLSNSGLCVQCCSLFGLHTLWLNCHRQGFTCLGLQGSVSLNLSFPPNATLCQKNITWRKKKEILLTTQQLKHLLWGLNTFDFYACQTWGH